MQKANSYISENNIEKAIIELKSSNFNNIAELLSKTVIIRVKLLCNWTSSQKLCNTWNKMSKGNYTWNTIKIVWEDPVDYYVVINCPPMHIFPPLDKTVLFQMEPHMSKNPNLWGDWAKAPIDKFLFFGNHDRHYNNNEWHLSKTWKELTDNTCDKTINIMSTVLSDKYSDPGHIRRIDFVKFLEKKNLPVHVYGGNKFEWKDYKGTLPYHCKDDALFPYKYTFNVENHSTKGYYTEKLIDGILAECLTVYHGCINIKEYIDEDAFVWIEMVDFEHDYQLIKSMIEEDWHTKRLPAIRRMKNKILNDTQFFPRLERILNNNSK